MSTDNTQLMQEALQAAVRRIHEGGGGSGNGGGGGAPGMGDPLGMLMTVLPKLLNRNDDEREELGEKVDAVKKDAGSLRADVLALRKQLHRVFKMQEQTLAELRDLQKQQLALGQAVLELADEMARIEIVDAPVEGQARGAAAAPAAAPAHRARNGRAAKR